MTPHQISLVQGTWKQVAPIADTAASLFYGRLFELDASLKPMFTTDPVEQGRKLMAIIGTAVASLGRIEQLVPTLHRLGARHAGYGVRDAHYGTVAAALLWTLERGLGDAFTEDVKGAWTAAYVLLSTTMRDGAAMAMASGMEPAAVAA